jgi:hypothetical protein
MLNWVWRGSRRPISPANRATRRAVGRLARAPRAETDPIARQLATLKPSCREAVLDCLPAWHQTELRAALRRLGVDG